MIANDVFFCFQKQINENIRMVESSSRLEWLQSHVNLEGLGEVCHFHSHIFLLIPYFLDEPSTADEMTLFDRHTSQTNHLSWLKPQVE